MNILVQIWAARGTFTRESHLAVTNAGMYWHFVDVVWLFVFASLYISPRLG
jgi:cytochrome c oxidase subunit 3